MDGKVLELIYGLSLTNLAEAGAASGPTVMFDVGQRTTLCKVTAYPCASGEPELKVH
jgi:hypothetical protein